MNNRINLEDFNKSVINMLQEPNDDDRIKMIRDLNVNELFTIYGKEEEYTKNGILRILKVRDQYVNEFRLYATGYLASYLKTDQNLVDGVQFIVKEFLGVETPIIQTASKKYPPRRNSITFAVFRLKCIKFPEYVPECSRHPLAKFRWKMLIGLKSMEFDLIFKYEIWKFYEFRMPFTTETDLVNQLLDLHMYDFQEIYSN